MLLRIYSLLLLLATVSSSSSSSMDDAAEVEEGNSSHLRGRGRGLRPPRTTTTASSTTTASASATTPAALGVVTCPKQNRFLETMGSSYFSSTNAIATLRLDSTRTYQSIQGFGYTLTGGSAQHLMTMNSKKRNLLLQEIFTTKRTNVVRVSIGASDLDVNPFSYDDLPSGVSTDLDLQYFSINRDRQYVIPALKAILKKQPKLEIWATPWSAPSWMKDTKGTVGGSLKPEYFETYAKYLVRYLQAMQTEGLPIRALTIQNEPLNGHNNPSMYMTGSDQGKFLRDFLAPAFVDAGLATWDGTTFDSTVKIVIYDHNADRIDYPMDILNDPTVRPFADGSAFHLYAGSIAALSQVHDAHPDKNIYFTEQWVSSTGSMSGDLLWHAQNVLIGGLRNYARTIMEWNLSSNPSLTPHTDGGCTQCLGAVTINGSTSSYSRNVAYYLISGHASAYIPPGSVRIDSFWDTNSQHVDWIDHVALKTPNGKTVLLLANRGWGNDVISIPELNNLKVELKTDSLTTLVF